MTLAVFKSNFSGNELRFVMVGEDLFVSRYDLVACIKDCATDYVKPVVEDMVDKWLQMACDSSDTKGAIIGDSSIGPAIHFHAVGNMLDAMSGFHYAENDEMRESGFRINALLIWYSDICASANEYFGMGYGNMLSSVKNRLDRINPAFQVYVTHDNEAWIAECDALGLVTEANSYEELTERVWEIAAELYVLNGLGNDPDGMRISFIQEQSSDERMAL